MSLVDEMFMSIDDCCDVFYVCFVSFNNKLINLFNDLFVCRCLTVLCCWSLVFCVLITEYFLSFGALAARCLCSLWNFAVIGLCRV